jgi:CheY-like chemotaxis protein
MEGTRAFRGRRATQGAERPAGSKTPALIPPATTSLRATRVLVATAKPSTGRLCREVLEAAGVVVELADSGIGTLIAARERPPRAILMDLQLRDVPALEAIDWLRSNPALRSIPVIIILAGNEEGSSPAPRPGAVLRYPLSPKAIRRAIREVLRPVP